MLLLLLMVRICCIYGYDELLIWIAKIENLVHNNSTERREGGEEQLSNGLCLLA